MTHTARSHLTAFCLVVMIFASSAGCGAPVATARLGDKAVPLEGLTFVKGGPVTLAEGQIYVIEFWATWCSPCRRSIPHLTELQKAYQDQGVTVIGISSENQQQVESFVSDQGDKMAYTVAIAERGGAVITGYMRAYGRSGIPSAFVVNRSMQVVWVGHPMNGLDQVLKQVVDGGL